MTPEHYFRTKMCANCDYFEPCLELHDMGGIKEDRVFAVGRCTYKRNDNDVFLVRLTDVCPDYTTELIKGEVEERIEKIASQLRDMATEMCVNMDADEFDNLVSENMKLRNKIAEMENK